MAPGKILVIVESPGKLAKIQAILGDKYLVVASVGHIIDLDPKKKIEEVIDTKNKTYEPTYVPITRGLSVIKKLKDLYAKSSGVLLAADEDREGEMIAWSVAHVLGIKDPQRILFNSITKDAILNAVKSPTKLNQNLIDAQKTRRILDRIVGYKLSPLLWKNVQMGLSAGRVQSVIVKLIIEKENEIKAFFTKGADSFFKFKGTFFEKKNGNFVSSLHDLNSVAKDGAFKGSESKINSEDAAQNFLKKCTQSAFLVANVFDKKSLRNPSAPFTTSTMQQASHTKLGMSIKRTMMAAQNLYEAGYITYMRTDSVNLSKEAIEAIKKYVVDTHGESYYRFTEYKSKSQNIQEAHEAVRPTDVYKTNILSGAKIGTDEIRLYSLIWKRAVASQMNSAEFNITSIQISISKDNTHYFQTQIENLIFPGFLAVYNIVDVIKEDDQEGADADEDKVNENIPVPKIGATLNTDNIKGSQEYTKPPYRYNDGSMSKVLDEEHMNIGRPATTPGIVTKVLERHYVKIDNVAGEEKDSITLCWDGKKIKELSNKVIIGAEKDKYIPTELGILVTDYLETGFPEIMDYKFTADMETKLDDIAAGKKVWNKVLDEFYSKFDPLVALKMKEKPIIQEKYTTVLGNHPETGDEIIATLGRFGPMVKMCPVDGPQSKCKFAPIKEPITLATVTLADALKLFEYPIEIGKYEKKMIELNRGKYGFYIKWGTSKFAVTTGDLSLEDAIKVIEEKRQKSLAEFKSDTKIYTVLEGPYGKYINVAEKKKTVKGKKVNVKLPDTIKLEELTLEKVQQIVESYFNRKFKRKGVEGGAKTDENIKPVDKPATKATTAKAPTATKSSAKASAKASTATKSATKPATTKSTAKKPTTAKSAVKKPAVAKKYVIKK